MGDRDLEKIAHQDLREFAANLGESDRRSVIVELAAEPQMAPREPWRANALIPKGPSAASPPNQGAMRGQAELMDRLEEALATLGLADDLVRLEAAESFVVNVTPLQLRSIASLDITGVVRPNRSHNVAFSDIE